MKTINIFLSVLLAVTLLMADMVCHDAAIAEVCNRIVAIVNKDIITLHELNNKIKQYTGLDPEHLTAANQERYLQARRKILELLIDEKIAHDKVKELGIEISEAEIDSYIENIKKDNHLTQEDLIKSLKEQGISYESYRKKIRSDIERMQLIEFEVKSKIVISDEKIKGYYETHQDEFNTGETVHLAAIFIGLEGDPSDRDAIRKLYRKTDVIMSRLRNGQDFGELADKFSQGPGAGEGGDLGVFSVSDLDPELKKIVESLPEGGVSKPIMKPSGIQIVKLIERQERGLKSLDKVKNSIYWKLYQDEVNKRYTSWIKRLREKSYTKIIF